MPFMLYYGAVMKGIIIFFFLFSHSVFAQDFLREFDGREVSCEISSYNEDLIPSFFRTSFILQEILVSFDDKEMTEVLQGGKPLENLYSIKYQLRSRQGTMQFFFNMDFSKAVFSKKGRKHILEYADDYKTYRLEFSDGLIRDKYKFIKNGKTEFTCRSFF